MQTATTTTGSDRHRSPSYPLRMPDDLREQLDAVSHWNHRSLNSEIVTAIEKHVTEEIRKREAK